MILGAGAGQLPLIRRAKEAGWHTIVVSPKGDYPGFALADEIAYCDIADIDAIAKLAQTMQIDAIVTGVVRGVAYEVRGYISALDHGQVFITGGHAPYILQNLHSATPSPYHTTAPSTTPYSCPSTTTSTTYPEFLHPERHLVLIGLNKVLNHNLS